MEGNVVLVCCMSCSVVSSPLYFKPWAAISWLLLSSFVSFPFVFFLISYQVSIFIIHPIYQLSKIHSDSVATSNLSLLHLSLYLSLNRIEGELTSLSLLGLIDMVPYVRAAIVRERCPVRYGTVGVGCLLVFDLVKSSNGALTQIT